MRALGRFLGRILFWSYDRGTVPYDLLVIGIVAFVFFSPRTWFHDQPDSGPQPQQAQVGCVAEDAPSKDLRCRVDAHALFPSQRSPELQEKVHEVLRINAVQLNGKTFQIVQIEPVLNEAGGVLYYDVSVRP